MLTESAIKTQAAILNAEYDGAAEFIAGGEAVIQVMASTDSSGWNLKLVVVPAVRGSDGGTVYAAEPTVIRWKALRLQRTVDAAKRAAKVTYPDAMVPVRVLIDGKEVA